MKVLIFGQAGAGKTTLCNELAELIGERAVHINADKMRTEANDWDFSEAGRWRQFRRMLNKANAVSEAGKIALVDFICPFKSGREQFDADLTIFMSTVIKGRYEDTNKIFEWPEWTEYDYDLNEWDEENAGTVLNSIGDRMFNSEKPTVQLLGRYQPWHDGHTALFEKALAKTGQVEIMIRDMEPSDNNPWSQWDVAQKITIALAPYVGLFNIKKVSNIVNITYGRDVGYAIEQEHLGEEIEKISATEIRKHLADKL